MTSTPDRDGKLAAGRAPSGALALMLAIAAFLACWNPLAAPFGLGLGVAGLVLAARAVARGAPRRRAVTALLLSVASAAASVIVLALSAGSLGAMKGEPVVQARTAAELESSLKDMANRTASERARANEELSRVERQKDRSETAPDRSIDGGKPRR